MEKGKELLILGLRHCANTSMDFITFNFTVILGSKDYPLNSLTEEIGAHVLKL